MNQNRKPGRGGTLLIRWIGVIGTAGLLSGCSQPFGVGGSDPYQSYNGANGANNGAFNSGIPSSGNYLPGRRSSSGNPAVISGLKVQPTGKWNLRVDTGAANIGGKQVAFTQPAALTETPVPSLEVKGEKVAIGDDPPHLFDHGTKLKELVSDVTTLPGALDPASLVVWSAPTAPRQQYKLNTDYLLDPTWGEISRKPGGSIPAGATVYVDYKIRQVRLDTVEVRPDGKVELKTGTPAKTSPTPAAADPDSVAIATVFLDYGADSVRSDSIYPIGTPYPDPTPDERKAMALTVAKTRAKLQANTPVTVVFWGDSVTAGGTTTTPEKRFPDLVGQDLKLAYKGAKVTIVNAGVGGSNIQQRLPKLDEEVISHHPDLVVVEFVNDMGLPPAEVRKDYTEAVERLKKAGSEVILTTPHFTMPTWMGMKSLHDRDPRPDVEVIRQVARQEKVGLADVSRRWEHLASEGLPYTALLYNGINHPDDRGHAIYAKAISSFF